MTKYDHKAHHKAVRNKAVEDGYAKHATQIKTDMICDDGKVFFRGNNFYSTYVRLEDYEIKD